MALSKLCLRVIIFYFLYYSGNVPTWYEAFRKEQDTYFHIIKIHSLFYESQKDLTLTFILQSDST